MKAIEVASLIPGVVTQSAYFSDSGNLLLSKGVTISQHHIDVLLRRNVFTIYTSDNEAEEGIRRLLDSSFQNPSDIGKDAAPPLFSSPSDPSGDEPSVERFPSLRGIESGEEGYKKLLESPEINEVEGKISRDIATDKPMGPPLASRARQMTARERTAEYKRNIKLSYCDALDRSAHVQLDIVNCRLRDLTNVREIVDTFIKTFVSDRNMLLNLSASKPAGEDYWFNHSLNVCLLAITIASAAGYSEQQVSDIGIGALLHDIGMLLVPRSIRMKKDKLTEEEWFEVRKHPVLALHILEKVDYLPDSVTYIVYQSHERENGKGYPKQRAGQLIHSYAKIVQLADVYESMSSSRPYRAPFLPYKAMEALIKMAHEGALKIDLVKNFLVYASLFPVGSLVELSDHRIGKVIQANGALFAKPVVSIIGENGVRFQDASRMYPVDLAKNSHVQITRPLSPDSLKGLDIMDGF